MHIKKNQRCTQNSTKDIWIFKTFKPELSDLLLHGYNDVNTEFFQPVQTNSVSPDKIFQSVSVQVLDYKGSRVIDQEQTNEAVRFNNKN